MGSQCFDAEGFGGVVPAVEDVDAEFLGHRIGPMRTFAGDESVYAFVGCFFEIASCSACDDTDAAADLGTAGNCQWFRSSGASQARGQFGARNYRLTLKTQELAMIEKERAQFFQSKRRAELGVVAKFGMRVQRQMRAVDGEVVLEQQSQQFVSLACPRMRRSPKKSVMDNQEISVGANSQFDCGQRGIYGGGDAGDGAAIFDLQAVGGSIVIFYVGGTQHAIAMRDNRFQRRFCHWLMETECGGSAKREGLLHRWIGETVKTVDLTSVHRATPLKRGVNEIGKQYVQSGNVSPNVKALKRVKAQRAWTRMPLNELDWLNKLNEENKFEDSKLSASLPRRLQKKLFTGCE